jgi:hypothetical protein
MPEATIGWRDLHDVPRLQRDAFVWHFLAGRGFDLRRPFRSQDEPLYRRTRFWQEDPPRRTHGPRPAPEVRVEPIRFAVANRDSPNETEEMRRAYREMMGHPDIVAAQEECRRLVERALQDVVNRLVAQHFPRQEPPAVRHGESDLRAAYRPWRAGEQMREAQSVHFATYVPTPSEADCRNIIRQVAEAIRGATLAGLQGEGEPGPEEPLTTDQLRERLGPDEGGVRAVFDREGGFRWPEGG